MKHHEKDNIWPRGDSNLRRRSQSTCRHAMLYALDVVVFSMMFHDKILLYIIIINIETMVQ